jgi:hypothetical protein
MNASTPPRGQPEPASPPESAHENAIVAWIKAIAGGIQDTAHDVLEEGRRGARESYEEYWQRFEAKTKHRRQKRQ